MTENIEGMIGGKAGDDGQKIYLSSNARASLEMDEGEKEKKDENEDEHGRNEMCGDIS